MKGISGSKHGLASLCCSLMLILVLLIVQLVFAIDLDIDDPESIKTATKAVATEMLTHYTGMNPGDVPGNLPTPYYWWEAGAMFGALIDYWFYTGDTTWNNITTQALLWQASPTRDFIPANQSKTEGNDDQSFWGMAALTAAERNFPNPPPNQAQWLELAQAVFNGQTTRWDQQYCGGGLRWQIFTWNNGYDYKNTISNGCFFNIAARLARYTGNHTYSEWAERAWEWTENIGFMTDNFHFWDGAGIASNCTQYNKIEWTYNAAVYMLGAAAMYNLTSSPEWKQRTLDVLNASSVFFVTNPPDVMYERACETVNTCEVDQRSFKAYMSRWMGLTTQLAPFTHDLIMPKLRASAIAAAKTCTGGPSGRNCGLKWTLEHWDGSIGVGEQMSVMEVLQANLIDLVPPPVTNNTGGTSQGNPNAGMGNNGGSAGGTQGGNTPGGIHTRPITTGDRAGAGILTTLMLAMFIGVSGWMVYE